jgi:Domain of unknown function (DUF4132)
MSKTAKELLEDLRVESSQCDCLFEDLISVKTILKTRLVIKRDIMIVVFKNLSQLLLETDNNDGFYQTIKSLPEDQSTYTFRVIAISEELLQKILPFEKEHYEEIFNVLSLMIQRDYYRSNLVNGLTKNLQKYLSHEKMEVWSALKESINKILKSRGIFFEENLRIKAKLLRIVRGSVPLPLRAYEAWTEVIVDEIKNSEGEKMRILENLIVFLGKTPSGIPKEKWLKTAHEHIKKYGEKEFLEKVILWLSLLGKPASDSVNKSFYTVTFTKRPEHEVVLKGLVLCCSHYKSIELLRLISHMSDAAYHKFPGSGAVGNACAWVLSQSDFPEALAQLAYLKVKVKQKSVLKQIEKFFQIASERLGIPRDEIEEMGIPDYGLTEVGKLEVPLGDFTAQLNITGTSKTELVWIKPDGKVQKSVPAAVKKEFPEEVKELKESAKEIQKMLPAHRDRIDNLFLEQRTWPLNTWKKRYLDHPLTGYLARKIIWIFTKGKKKVSGIWSAGEIVDRNDKPIKLDEKTEVELWHPIHEEVEAVLEWRSWLEKHEVQQPFKQAHREIYLLTDAERSTNVYSNRYASHIIKQHQFNALCGVRNWLNTLRLTVNDSYPPATKLLPKWDLKAEFWIEEIGDETGHYINEVGTYLYLSTDQVRFYAIDDEETPVPLEEIPPIVFSEIMRDVDLFVGVASVGNDPNWADGGRERPHIEYWNTYSFGELTETAKTRKEILEKLLPRLKIADQCSFDDKFLVVKGDIRTYKIHLGSSNILMAPNDAYLCIVPKQGTAKKEIDGLYLPFEGDSRLSAILSKAFLLADDKKIKDKTIISQIGSL